MLLSFEDLLRLHNIFSILFLQRSYDLCKLKPDLFVFTCAKESRLRQFNLHNGEVSKAERFKHST